MKTKFCFVPTHFKKCSIFFRLMIPILISTTTFAQNGDEYYDMEGQFTLTYGAFENPNYQPVYNLLINSELFDIAVDELNENLYLPYDINIQFKETPDGPHHQDGNIVINYEFLSYHASLFAYADADITQEELAQKVLDITEFVLYHEVGHALVAAYDIPILGKEEDAADALAMVVSAAILEEPEIALAAAESFNIATSGQQEMSALSFWDEHSLSQQRMASILCWVYGSDPNEFAFLIESGIMPVERADFCQREYESKVRDWMDVLEPYIKE